jgi:hypothetical protein
LFNTDASVKLFSNVNISTVNSGKSFSAKGLFLNTQCSPTADQQDEANQSQGQLFSGLLSPNTSSFLVGRPKTGGNNSRQAVLN